MDGHVRSVVQVEHHDFKQRASVAVPAQVQNLHNSLVIIFVQCGHRIRDDVLNVRVSDAMLSG
ncbi:MAG: hypothetical protein ACRDHX_14065 [Chloroflexota bacterium]